MARIRTIKPDMGESRDISKLSFAARYFFALLLCHLDDLGRAEWMPKKICGAMYPHDDEVDSKQVSEWLDECVRAGLIFRYEVNSITYIYSPTFAKHQTINKPTSSRCPTPPLQEEELVTTVGLPESSRNGVGPERGKGKGEIGKEKEISPQTPQGVERTFRKPTVIEVQDYMTDRGFPTPLLIAENFVNHYQAKGWKVGRDAMQDWRACVRTWESKMKKDGDWPKPEAKQFGEWDPDRDPIEGIDFRELQGVRYEMKRKVEFDEDAWRQIHREACGDHRRGVA